MPLLILLEGGPYAGRSLQFENTPNNSFGLPVDRNGMPCDGPPFGLAGYSRKGSEDSVYAFQRITPVAGQPFLIEFADGPAKGVYPADQPAAYLDQMQAIPVLSDDAVYRGQGAPAGLATYQRRQDAGTYKYHLVEIDRSVETVQRLIDEENDRKITEAINNFYAAPDYDIYTMKPTGEHVQVPVEVGHRRGHVDEAIAPLIKRLWELGLDTLGSCQRRPPGHDHEGQAYVAFPKERDGVWFRDLLETAHIECNVDAKQITIAKKGPSGEITETLALPSANVILSPGDIDRIVELLAESGRQNIPT